MRSTCFPVFGHVPWLRQLAPIDGMVPGIDPSTPIQELPIASIDLETTGVNPLFDRIVEIAIVKNEKNEKNEKEVFESLINPGIAIPALATAVHGIGGRLVVDSPWFGEINISDRVELCVPLAYNAEFDRGFLRYEAKRHGVEIPWLKYRWIDPLVWVRELYPSMRSKRLGAVCNEKRFSIPYTEAHRAMPDAFALLSLWKKLVLEIGNKTYEELLATQQRLSLEQMNKRKWKG